MTLGKLMRPLLPASLKAKVPAPQTAGAWPARTHAKKVLLLEGCVQPAMAPNINTATARVLDALGIETLRPKAAGCCGAIRYHLNDHEGGLDDARRNIDAWWPYIKDAEAEGVIAIVMNASGCGVQVTRVRPHAGPRSGVREEGGTHQRNGEGPRRTPARARRRTEAGVACAERRRRVVFHPPCTLQHGQKVQGRGRGTARVARRAGAARGRVAFLLRLGRHLLGAAGRSSRSSCATAGSAICWHRGRTPSCRPTSAASSTWPAVPTPA